MPTNYVPIVTKKFLDFNGLTYFSSKLNNYPTNDVIEAVIDGVQDALDEKADADLIGQVDGIAELDENGNIPLTRLTEMVGATSNQAGTAGLVPAPAASDVEKFLRGDGHWVKAAVPMSLLSYGSSTWQDFIDAYNENAIVYCKASSNANPGTGSQGRMAFMAFVNFSNNTPTSVEFQYYRSVSSHSASQQGDQVFIYKLESTNGGKWSVTTREASSKIAAGTNMSSSYSSGTLTLNVSLESKTAAAGGTDVSLVTTGEKAIWNGKADLDEYGKIPSSQLPSYVDDVLEFANSGSFPAEGSSGVIYIAIDTSYQYRWTGSTYVKLPGEQYVVDGTYNPVSNKVATESTVSNAIAGITAITNAQIDSLFV